MGNPDARASALSEIMLVASLGEVSCDYCYNSEETLHLHSYVKLRTACILGGLLSSAESLN